ncbi:hypothetical protein C8R44DRAFT_878157 [Mycena epipterygia]|nr:hypothetical protein C8R44DRAFT_878157 [Mycena epipterygia]
MAVQSTVPEKLDTEIFFGDVQLDPSPTAPVSHLHLFKGARPDDRELERLEINADSVVFVAEFTPAECPSPHVVNVGGADTPSAGSPPIKNAIFEQRSQRAGLGTPIALSGTEPRGNMDVMLSMRLHASESQSQSQSQSKRPPLHPRPPALHHLPPLHPPAPAPNTHVPHHELRPLLQGGIKI